MSLPNLLPAAQRELLEAIDWYEDRRPGLGIEFLGAVDLALGRIAETPERFPVWPARPAYRRLILDRYPYVMFYHLRESGPEVVAIAHSSRRPGYWLTRIK